MMGEFFAITFIILLAAISPGPDFAMVVKNSLLYSKRGGIYTSLGITISLFVHATYCMMGLAIIISKSLLLFNVIKYIGSAYLIYIGTRALFSKKTTQSHIEHTDVKSINRKTAFWQGLLCNLLNPKAIMFLLALFTMVIKPTTPMILQIIYVIDIGLIHFVWFCSLSIFLTHHKVSKLLQKIQFIVTKVMGGVLVMFGIRIATLAQQL